MGSQMFIKRTTLQQHPQVSPKARGDSTDKQRHNQSIELSGFEQITSTRTKSLIPCESSLDLKG